MCQGFKIVEERFANPEEHIPNPEEPIPNREERIRNPEEHIPNREERIPNPEEPTPNPEERIPAPESQPPNLSLFLLSVMLQLEVIRKESNDFLLADSSFRTVEIVIGNGTVITFDIREVEDETPGEEVNN